MFSDCEKCRGRSVGSRVIDSRQSTDDSRSEEEENVLSVERDLQLEKELRNMN